MKNRVAAKFAQSGRLLVGSFHARVTSANLVRHIFSERQPSWRLPSAPFATALTSCNGCMWAKAMKNDLCKQ